MTFAIEPRTGRAVTEPAESVAPAGRRRSRWPLVALAAVALAAGCSTGPGSQAEFVEVLTRGGALTDSEASCIADAVFAEYAADPDALGKISAAPDYEYLSGAEGVPGFTDFFDSTVKGCAQVGPTTS